MIGLPLFTDRKEQLNIITKSNPDTQRYNVGVEFTNFPNVKRIIDILEKEFPEYK